jgi:hypothetical protein
MHKTIGLWILLAGCGTALAESIPLINEHGTYLLPVEINDKISLNFTLDSGASDVSIPADVFSTLVRAGTIAKADLLGKQVYKLADGSEHESQRFRIRSLRVGSFELHDVIGIVAPAEGGLLLGQSFLSRIKSWSIDNEQHMLVLNQPPILSGSTLARSTVPPVHHPTTAPADDSALLKAVAFALTGEDGAHVTVVDRANCIFQYVDNNTLFTLHLNNIDVARMAIQRDGEMVNVTIFGESVVADWAPGGGQPSFLEATTPGHVTHFGFRYAVEYQRTVRAWKFIYSHGCTGHKSSF